VRQLSEDTAIFASRMKGREQIASGTVDFYVNLQGLTLSVNRTEWRLMELEIDPNSPGQCGECTLALSRLRC